VKLANISASFVIDERRFQNPIFSAYRMPACSMALPGRSELLHGLHAASASTACASRCRAASAPSGPQARTTITLLQAPYQLQAHALATSNAD